jgi:hypothetical protein
MGATSMVGCAVAGVGRPQLRREDTPDPIPDSGAPAWGYLVHPSLMPTVFARSERAPGGEAGEKVAARKV